jgi:hypothetical protein
MKVSAMVTKKPSQQDSRHCGGYVKRDVVRGDGDAAVSFGFDEG